MKKSKKLNNKFEWLVDCYQTRDPAEIACCLKINILKKHLGDNLSGLYIFDLNMESKWIVLNIGLNPIMERFVLTHELGHAILHPEVSSIHVGKNYFSSNNLYCNDANQFAAFLLIEDKKIMKYIHRDKNLNKIALKLKVPKELVKMKMELMEKNFAG